MIPPYSIRSEGFLNSFEKLVNSVYTSSLNDFVNSIPPGWDSFRGKESEDLSEIVKKCVNDIEQEAEEVDLEMISYGKDDTPRRDGVFKTELKNLNLVTEKMREVALYCENRENETIFPEVLDDEMAINERIKECIAKITLYIAVRSVANIFCSTYEDDEDEDDNDGEGNSDHLYAKISHKDDNNLLNDSECVQRILFFFKRISANDCNDANEIMHKCCDLIGPDFHVEEYPFTPSFILSFFAVDVVDINEEVDDDDEVDDEDDDETED